MVKETGRSIIQAPSTHGNLPLARIIFAVLGKLKNKHHFSTLSTSFKHVIVFDLIFANWCNEIFMLMHFRIMSSRLSAFCPGKIH